MAREIKDGKFTSTVKPYIYEIRFKYRPRMIEFVFSNTIPSN